MMEFHNCEAMEKAMKRLDTPPELTISKEEKENLYTLMMGNDYDAFFTKILYCPFCGERLV